MDLMLKRNSRREMKHLRSVCLVFVNSKSLFNFAGVRFLQLLFVISTDGISNRVVTSKRRTSYIARLNIICNIEL